MVLSEPSMRLPTLYRQITTFFFQEKTEENELKTKKQKTKIAAAKKLLNKNVKLNTKIVFDEEGEVRLKLRKKYSVCQSTI